MKKTKFSVKARSCDKSHGREELVGNWKSSFYGEDFVIKAQPIKEFSRPTYSCYPNGDIGGGIYQSSNLGSITPNNADARIAGAVAAFLIKME